MKPSTAHLRNVHDGACSDMASLVAIKDALTSYRSGVKSAAKTLNADIAREALRTAADHIDDHVLSVLDTAIEDMEREYGISRDGWTEAAE